MKPLGHFPAVIISVCLGVFAYDSTLTYGTDNQDVTVHIEIQELKIQVNSLTSIVEHLLKESDSKETKVNYLTSVIQLFLEESKSKETRISSLENTVAKLENTIHIQTEMNSHVVKETQDNLTLLKSNQEKISVYLTTLEDSNPHLTNESSTKNNIHSSNIENTGYSTQEVVMGQHAIYKRVPEIPKPKIAFHARLSHGQTTTRGRTITFDQKTLDTANAYHSDDGIFIAPETGVYVFSWTINGDGHTWAFTEIVVNGHAQGQTIADSDAADDYRAATGTLVTALTAGDHVYIRFKDTTYLKGYLDVSRGQCTFSGWKLD